MHRGSTVNSTRAIRLLITLHEDLLLCPEKAMGNRSRKKVTQRTNSNQLDLFAIDADSDNAPAIRRHSPATAADQTNALLSNADRYVVGSRVKTVRRPNPVPSPLGAPEARLLDMRAATRQPGLRFASTDAQNEPTPPTEAGRQSPTHLDSEILQRIASVVRAKWIDQLSHR